MSKMKVLIADNLAQDGVDILNAYDQLEVTYNKKTPLEDLLNIIGDYEGLIIRSATKVTPEVLEKATKLKVVIRAGVGVDNINIPACSQKGIVVMNAPAGNSISTAEQAIALMFSIARKTAQANMSMKAKKWEKAKFQGTQITGKTLGVIGLGRIGKEVVLRAKGLKMNVIGFDPYIPKGNLEHLQIELGSVDDVLAKSDFITVHTPLTDTTKHLINSDNLNKLKDGVYLMNGARGGIYEEAALVEGLKSGKIAAVGLDVFTQEPPPADFPLYELDNCIMTPHLGASTDEAQVEVAKETASSMVSFLKEGVARNSLNFPTIDPAEMNTLSDWFKLSEQVGSFACQVLDKPVQNVTLDFEGDITNLNLRPLEIAFSKGLLSVAMGETVNLVNAPVLAKERGINIAININKDEGKPSLVKAKVSDGSETIEIHATVNFSGGAIIGINNLPIEFKPSGHVLYIYNQDVPKVVGELGNLLGDNNVNIASLQLARQSKGGKVISVIELDHEVSADLLENIRAKDFIDRAKYIFI